MSTKFAIIIAIESYHDGKFQKVDYAENDARELAEILEKHGFADQTLLINGDATKARIDSNLRRTIDRLAIEFEFDQPMNMEDFIDELERIRDIEESLTVNYPSDNSHCKFSTDRWAFNAFVTSMAMTLEFQTRESPAQLLQDMVETQKFLVKEHNVKILPA